MRIRPVLRSLALSAACTDRLGDTAVVSRYEGSASTPFMSAGGSPSGATPSRVTVDDAGLAVALPPRRNPTNLQPTWKYLQPAGDKWESFDLEDAERIEKFYQLQLGQRFSRAWVRVNLGEHEIDLVSMERRNQGTGLVGKIRREANVLETAGFSSPDHAAHAEGMSDSPTQPRRERVDLPLREGELVHLLPAGAQASAAPRTRRLPRFAHVLCETAEWQADDLADDLINAWFKKQTTQVRCLVSITGGMGSLEVPPTVNDLIKVDLGLTAQLTSGAFFTPGAARGVSELVGTALARNEQHKAMCIGVSSLRKLQRFDQILEAKQHRTGVLKADLNLGKDLIDPKSGTPVKADAIDQSHSHFVMVDTGSNKEYFTSARSRGRGGEIIPRARLEKSVSEKLGVPLVQVMIGGGPNTLGSVKGAIDALAERQHYMALLFVVVKGTGGGADDLAGLLAGNEKDREWCMQNRIMKNPQYTFKDKKKEEGPAKGMTNLETLEWVRDALLRSTAGRTDEDEGEQHFLSFFIVDYQEREEGSTKVYRSIHEVMMNMWLSGATTNMSNNEAYAQLCTDGFSKLVDQGLHSTVRNVFEVVWKDLRLAEATMQSKATDSFLSSVLGQLKGGTSTDGSKIIQKAYPGVLRMALGARPSTPAKRLERAELVRYLWERMEEITSRHRPTEPDFDSKRVRLLTEIRASLFADGHRQHVDAPPAPTQASAPSGTYRATRDATKRAKNLTKLTCSGSLTGFTPVVIEVDLQVATHFLRTRLLSHTGTRFAGTPNLVKHGSTSTCSQSSWWRLYRRGATPQRWTCCGMSSARCTRTATTTSSLRMNTGGKTQFSR